MKLDDLKQQLDRRDAPLWVFFRDDDAGWEDAHLARLLNLFARLEAPLDLAVIPSEAGANLTTLLGDARERQPLGLHQHGYTHRNHEREGRKCEFGPARRRAAQEADIREGARLLAGAFGATDPIFTPPWNRCTQNTVECLVAQGFRALSRDASATDCRCDGLARLTVNLDWQKPDSPVNLAAGSNQLGVMLHHAVMADSDFEAIKIVIRTLKSHPMSRLVLMRDLLETPAPIAASTAERGAVDAS